MTIRDRSGIEAGPSFVHIPRADVDDLPDHLVRTRLPEELPGAG